MNGSDSTTEKNNNPESEIGATLEKKYIEEYLLGKGYRRDDLRELPKEKVRQLMVKAPTYASLRLADIESKAGFRKKIRWDL